MSRIGLLAFLGMFLVAAIAAAQDRQEALGIGVVIDEDDRPVANAEVRGLWLPEQGSPFVPSLVVVKSDDQGRFMVPLPAGDVRGIELIASDAEGNGTYERRYAASVGKAVSPPARLVLKECRKHSVRVQNQEGKPLPGVNVSCAPEFLGQFTQQTDQQGNATVLMPERMTSSPIVAWDEELGLDYAHVSGPYNKAKEEKSDNGPSVVDLTLDPWVKRSVRIVDFENNPLPGVVLIPQGYWLADQRGILTSCALWAVYTNDEGVAEIIYPKTTRFLNVDVDRPGFHRKRISPLSSGFKGDVVLTSLKRVSGKVTHADGSPAEGISVYFHGRGPRVDPYQISAQTDDEGRFRGEVPGDSYCLIMAEQAGETASLVEKRVVHLERDAEPVELTLQPMVKVFGVGVDRDGNPIANESVYCDLLDGDEGNYFDHLPELEKLPSLPNSRSNSRSYYRKTSKTDGSGKFEMLLPQGQYEGSLGFNGSKQLFTVEQATQLELTLIDDTRPKRILKVRVVKADEPDKGIQEAKVSFVSIPPDATRQTRFQHYVGNPCNAEGVCQFEMKDSAYVVSAVLPRKDLYAVASVPAGTKELTLKLAPHVSIQGRLLNADGSPVFRGSVTADIELTLGAELYSPVGHRGGYTDKEGKFVIEKLYPGQKYNIRIYRGLTPDKKSVVIEDIFSFTPELGDVKKDIGTFKLKPREND